MYKCCVKRLFDIVIGILALPIVIITAIIFAPIIYFSDKGPVFYISKRIGKGGKVFKMIKFRSMYVNSLDIRLDDGSTYNSEIDIRVTPIGRFLRKSSIDELPQFINVLFGQMSFIGPRPDPPDWLDKYPVDMKIFLTVRPGITGYNQAYFRNSADGEKKIQNDCYYALNYTFWMDVKVFFKTILIVVKHKDTYKVISAEKETLER